MPVSQVCGSSAEGAEVKRGSWVEPCGNRSCRVVSDLDDGFEDHLLLALKRERELGQLLGAGFEGLVLLFYAAVLFTEGCQIALECSAPVFRTDRVVFHTA